MKAILVMEMPENCAKCDFCDGDYCLVPNTGDGIGSYVTCRSGRCQLKPMPERKEEKYDLLQKDDSGNWRKCGEQTDLFGAGWNACIDAIEGSKG